MDLENIEELFKTEWEKIKTSKNKYRNINEWCDNFAMIEIKHFFIRIGKRKKKKIWLVKIFGILP